MNRALKVALSSLIFNAVFAIYYFMFGLLTHSWWLLTLGSYYLILSIVRFVVLRLKSRESFISKFTGWMLIILSVPLVGTVVLSVLRDRGHRLHMIVMIAMAVFAFTKITLATINLIKSRHTTGPLVPLRSISFADGFVSIFALQRSMLVSFEGMNESQVLTMNSLLGSAVCIIVFLLGLNLVMDKRLFGKLLNKNNKKGT